MYKVIIAINECLIVLSAVLAYAAGPNETQVLAKVGDAVITVQDLIAVAPMLSALGQQRDIEAGKQQLLEGLIGQELFAQEAMRLGLDKAPDVQAMLKQSRNNILVQAYMRWRSAQGVSISDEEVKQYFEAHRDDFQDKTLQEAAPQIRSKLTAAALKDQLAKTKAELRQREGVVIDEKVLQEVLLPTPTK